MKKIVLVGLVLLLNAYKPPICKNLTKVRWLFLKKVDTKTGQEIIDLCKKDSCKELIPYLAVAVLKQAEDVKSPFKKLTFFNEGKEILENYLKENPNSIEGHYMRYMTQKNIPKILGYYNKLDEDKKFFFNHIEKSNIETNYKKAMIQKMHEYE